MKVLNYFNLQTLIALIISQPAAFFAIHFQINAAIIMANSHVPQATEGGKHVLAIPTWALMSTIIMPCSTSLFMLVQDVNWNTTRHLSFWNILIHLDGPSYKRLNGHVQEL